MGHSLEWGCWPITIGRSVKRSEISLAKLCEDLQQRRGTSLFVVMLLWQSMLLSKRHEYL